MKTKFLTFSNNEFLPKALVCKESIERFYPSSEIETEIVFYDAPKVGPWLDGLAEMRIKTVKEQLERYDQIIMLGADCVLYNNIDAFLSIPGRIILVPHTVTPPSNSARFHRSGYANADVVCFRKGASAIINWLLTQPMRMDPNNGMVFEQTLLSCLPYVADDVAICKDPAINYAYYNFFERKLERVADKFYINGKPLALCQFSGYLDGEPDKISRHYHGQLPVETVLALFRQYEQNIATRIIREGLILNQIRTIDGYVEEEASLMISVAKQTVMSLRSPYMFVEVGSYCGHSTVVLGSVLKAISPSGKLFVIDLHECVNPLVNGQPSQLKPTISSFENDIETNGLTQIVQFRKQSSCEGILNKPISLLFVGGRSDKMNAVRDFTHFQNQILVGGYVLFQNYTDDCPGLKKFVDELLGTKRYVMVKCVKTLAALKKLRE